jgi:hypothetical protein
MRETVRLTRLPGGGFRVGGVHATPIDARPEAGGFAVDGEGSWRLTPADAGRGWVLTRIENGTARDGGWSTTSSPPPVASPASVLLPDGRLFRLAAVGLSEPRIELGRWDLPGAYVVGRPLEGGWELSRTAAGEALDAPPELWILTCAEIGRLDGWY